MTDPLVRLEELIEVATSQVGVPRFEEQVALRNLAEPLLDVVRKGKEATRHGYPPPTEVFWQFGNSLDTLYERIKEQE